MSDVVERTLSALPGLLGQPEPLRGGGGRSSAPSRLGGLIRSITALASKQEEEKLIQQELNSLKVTVSSPTTSLRLMKECMVRLIYCEMLGYEASFGYIHAIKLAQQGNLFEKRVGYLAVSLFLHENHELLLLLVNTVVKDLQSTNLMEVCMALTVASQIFPREMIPAVLPLVEDKLQHPKEIIRRKAVQALYKFYLIAPNQVQHIHDKFRKALCDRDVGVMAASLHIYLQMVKENSSGYKDLTGSFVAILKQVVGGKLPVDFNYHSVPAPWLQIQLLRILGLLGKDDPKASELMYDVLDESLRRAEINHNVTYAILFECVQTIYTIYPKADLLEKAAKCVGKFVLSPKINLKYLGLKALTSVVQQDPTLALQHQMTIIECLHHPDPIVKRETLELLYRITNGQNVTVIVQKMLDYLTESREEYTIINIVGKIAELAEKYAPDNEWFIQTMNAVFSIGGDKMHPDVPNSFLRLLAEGFDDAKEDSQLRLHAVQSYLVLLEDEKAVYPQRFLQVMSWVIGEYSYLMKNTDPEALLASLRRILRSNATPETKAWVMAAATKIASRAPHLKTVEALALEFTASLDTGVRQAAFELKHLCEDPELMKTLFPVDASGEDLVVDASLSFLDGFVAEGLARGAAPYKPPHQRQEEKLSQGKALNFEPYGLPLSRSFSASGATGRQSPTGLSLGSDISGNSPEAGQKETNGLRLDGVKQLWGKEGYLPKKGSPVEKEDSIRPVPQSSSPLAEPPVGHFPSQAGQEASSLSEEEKEKQQLASTLFVGLGSQGSVNLMGKGDPSTQKFTRRSKIHEGKTSEESSGRESPASPPATCHDPFHGKQELRQSHGRGRKASLGFPEASESKAVLDRSHSLPEAGPNERLLSHKLSPCALFADGEMDFSPRPPGAQAAARRLPSLRPSLAEEAAKHPHSEIVELCGNETLVLYFCKVWKEDGLLVFLFLVNQSTSLLKEVTLEFEHADRLKISERHGCRFDTIEAQSIGTFQTDVEIKELSSSAAISGSVHCDLALNVPLQFSVTLDLLDFIRPMKLTTEEFGKLWLALSNDVKQNLKMAPSQGSLSAVLNTLQQKLKLHVVDIIGNEGIAACRLLPSIPCLLHCRIHAGMVALWLRSSCPALPDCLLYQCQKAMEES
uniref:AP-4 complex subunit epsilon-1 isoform X1 n=3 Tax=Pogona vitticeps TaxID=103695 RepID=A0A6J0TDY9_9SAUR